AEAVAAHARVDPQDVDLRVAAPGEAVDAGDERAVVVAQEARERPAVAVAGGVEIERVQRLPQLLLVRRARRVGDRDLEAGAVVSHRTTVGARPRARAVRSGS